MDGEAADQDVVAYPNVGAGGEVDQASGGGKGIGVVNLSQADAGHSAHARNFGGVAAGRRGDFHGGVGRASVKIKSAHAIHESGGGRLRADSDRRSAVGEGVAPAGVAHDLDGIVVEEGELGWRRSAR